MQYHHNDVHAGRWTEVDVLICGAGAAGLSLAHLLGAQGHHVTLVEAAPAVRNGGLAIDVRADALEVAARMGILQTIQAARIRMILGSTFVDAADRVLGVMSPELVASEFYEEGEHDIEVSRKVLNGALLAAVDLPTVTLLYETSVVALAEDADRVDVTLNDGTVRRVDLVVGADGLHSAVRRLTFGPEAQFVHHLGIYVALFEVPDALAPEPGGRMYNTPGRMCSLLNYGDRTVAATLFRSPFLDHDHRDVARQQDIVREAYREETGWRVAEIVAALDAAPEFYFDTVSQVRLPTWSRGRVALIGDAAHCSALLSGMGTSLAMLGAAALADELAAAGGDHASAFARYQQRMLPVVARAQASVVANAEIMVPATQESIDRRHRLARGEAVDA